MKHSLQVIARDDLAGDTVPGELVDIAWEPPVPGPRRSVTNWKEYMALASRVVGRFHGQMSLHHFDYEHPTRLQPATPRRIRAGRNTVRWIGGSSFGCSAFSISNGVHGRAENSMGSSTATTRQPP